MVPRTTYIKEILGLLQVNIKQERGGAYHIHINTESYITFKSLIYLHAEVLQKLMWDNFDQERKHVLIHKGPGPHVRLICSLKL